MLGKHCIWFNRLVGIMHLNKAKLDFLIKAMTSPIKSFRLKFDGLNSPSGDRFTWLITNVCSLAPDNLNPYQMSLVNNTR